MLHPRITVVTVSYNAESLIEDTILSVVGQDYDNLEYIVIDGASKDRTLEVVGKYEEHIAEIVSEKDKGIYDAMNKGIAHATGDWVIFMNVGDRLYSKSTLSEVASYIDANNDALDVVYGNAEAENKYGNFPFIPRDISLLNRKMVLCHQAVFVKRSVLAQHPFDTKYRYAADYNQLSSLYLGGYRFGYCDVMIARCPKDEGATFSNFEKSTKEHFAILRSRGEKVFFEEQKVLFLRRAVAVTRSILPEGVYNTLFGFICKFKVV